MHTLDQELQETVQAAGFCSLDDGVVHVERAREAVYLLDRMDGIGYLDKGLLELCHMSCLLKQQEAAAADMGNREGLRKIFFQDGCDLLAQVLAEFWAISQANRVEFRYIDEGGRVIVSVQAVCIGEAQTRHDHAPVGFWFLCSGAT